MTPDNLSGTRVTPNVSFFLKKRCIVGFSFMALKEEEEGTWKQLTPGLYFFNNYGLFLLKATHKKKPQHFSEV